MDKFKFLKSFKVIFSLAGIAVLVLFLIWQSHRSTFKATFNYYRRVVNYRIHNGQIDGNFATNLNATWHRQEHSLSCEIAALKMALSVYGLNVPESELISKLNVDPTPRKDGVWGDPFTGFVGDIDGRSSNGYGVYWDPIADVAKKYVQADVMRFDSPSDLAAQLAKGRPVIAWGFTGNGSEFSWTTPAGKTINAIQGEHARTVVGFSGDVSNPTSFLVYDPIYGKLSWTPQQVFDNWKPFDNMGVVVYSDAVTPKINPSLQ